MSASDFNVHIGRILRRRRRLLALTQSEVAQVCGVGFQQIQKYECGGTSVSAARLWQLARALQVDIAEFFSGMEDVATTSRPAERRDAVGH